LHPSEEDNEIIIIKPKIGIWTHGPHQNVSLQVVECTKFSQSPCTHRKWLKQQAFLKLKWFFNVGCDQLTPSMAIVLLVHALHLGRVEWMGSNSNKASPSKVINKNWTFCKGILSLSKVHNSLKGCPNNTIMHKQKTID
jgi:hypothetical protein